MRTESLQCSERRSRDGIKMKLAEDKMERLIRRKGKMTGFALHCSISFNKHWVSRGIDLPTENPSREFILVRNENAHTRAGARCAQNRM